METIFLMWLVINGIGSLMMIIDKYNAIHKKKRIRERTLILTSCFGGALLMWITMYLAHHKTKHLHFVICFPLFTAMHLIIFYLLLR